MNNPSENDKQPGLLSRAPMFGAIAGLQGLGSLKALREKSPVEEDEEKAIADPTSSALALAPVGLLAANDDSVFSQPALTGCKEEESSVPDQVTYEMKKTDSQLNAKEPEVPVESLFSFKLPGLGAKPGSVDEAPKDAAEAPKQTVLVNKSGIMLSSLESNANMYLNQLRRENPPTSGPADQQSRPMILSSKGPQPALLTRANDQASSDLFPNLFASLGKPPGALSFGLTATAIAAESSD